MDKAEWLDSTIYLCYRLKRECLIDTLWRALQHEPIEPVLSMGGNLSVIVLGDLRRDA
jgi:hypothetical protein